MEVERDEVAPRDHFSPVQVRFPVNAPALRPPPAGDDNMPDQPINYDREDKADGDKANEQARHIKVEFDPNDVRFWFAQLEDEMEMAGVGRQWLKKSVVQRNLPLKQKEDVKELLTLQKENAGPNIYLNIKNELIRIYAPKPQDTYRRALTRTMHNRSFGLQHGGIEFFLLDFTTKNLQNIFRGENTSY